MDYNWFQIIISGLTVITAVSVAVTGYFNYRISEKNHSLNKEKFRLDLFDKRFAIYVAVDEFHKVISKDANCTPEDLLKFRKDTQDKDFLFGKDISEYISKIGDLAIELWRVKKVASADNAEKMGDLTQQLLNELTERTKVFAPYLRFDKWKIE